MSAVPGKMSTALVKQGNSFAIEVENHGCDVLLTGLIYRLMRLGYPVGVNSESNVIRKYQIKKVEQLPITPKPLKIYWSSDSHPERELVFSCQVDGHCRIEDYCPMGGNATIYIYKDRY